MGVPLARIYEVVTFYNYFKLERQQNTSFRCVWVQRATSRDRPGLLAGMEKELKVRVGQRHSGQGVSPASRSLPGMLWIGPTGFGQRQGLREAQHDG